MHILRLTSFNILDIDTSPFCGANAYPCFLVTSGLNRITFPASQTFGSSSGGSRIFARGAPTPKISIIFQIFAENCMKMKEFGPQGGARPWRPPLRSANVFALTAQPWIGRINTG